MAKCDTCPLLKKRVVVDITNTNWKRLREQKLALLNIRKVIDDEDGGEITATVDDIQGVIHFLDYVQDSAAEVLGEKAVFGNLK
jgi:hypothetical protein